MMPLQAAVLALVAAAGLAVVLARDPLRQAVVVALYGLLLAALFMVFQAPDVVLSMLGVGSIAYPLVILIAVARVRDQSEEKTDEIGR